MEKPMSLPIKDRCKIYDIVYENEVYPSRYYINNPNYLWWKFTPINPSGNIIIVNDIINYDKYFHWRNSLWDCKYPIRYPNTQKKKY